MFALCGRGDNVYMHKKDMSIIVSDDMFIEKNSCIMGSVAEKVHKDSHHNAVLLAASFGIGTLTINIIKNVLHADEEDITDITVLKKGMTNRSFLFSCKGK